jgi:hypothetical protein
MAHYDFGVRSFEEFGRMTPGMFIALMRRKQAQFTRDLFLQGTVAAAIWNSSGNLKEGKSVSPWDFIYDEKANEQREQLKKNIVSMVSVATAYTKADMDEVRENVIAKLTKAGYQDVAEIFEEAFPHWKRKK